KMGKQSATSVFAKKLAEKKEQQVGIKTIFRRIVRFAAWCFALRLRFVLLRLSRGWCYLVRKVLWALLVLS
ncbi:hypothetical protein, partial [Treponema endosymbiont of Eucomonympha sp.]|uniref:hypothetical protein n=1 Tax=Treponema endosymbiont of Eucomonympha sp. TaxID=1580831 RepID=UPI001E459B64